MIKSIKSQFLIMINGLSFKFAFSVSLLYNLVSYVLTVLVNRNVDLSMMYSADSVYAGNSLAQVFDIFSKLFPFLVIFPFSFSYIDDRNLKIHSYLLSRTTKRDYYLSKMINCFIGTFIIIFIPFLINLLLCHLTFPQNHNTFFGEYNWRNYFRSLVGSNVDVDINTKYTGLSFLKLYLYSPFLYNIFYNFLLSSFAGLMGIFSLSCSFIIKKYKILLFIPTYLIFYLGSIMDTVICNSGKSYFCTALMQYVSVGNTIGLSLIFILVFIVALMIFSLLSYFYICNKKEI